MQKKSSQFEQLVNFSTLLKGISLSILFLTIISFNSSAQVCSDPANVIYGMTNYGIIYPINVKTGVVGAALNPAYTGNGASASNAIGYNSVNGKFYYFKRDFSASPQEFVSFDPVTKTYALLATSPITKNTNSGCVSFDGSGYYCIDQDANLCYYDIASNTWTLITSKYVDSKGNNVTSNFNSYSSGDMGIDGLGNIWIINSGSGKYNVFEIAAPLPKTAVSSLVVSQIVPTTSTPGGNSFAGIAFSSNGKIYMSTPNGDDNLYRLESDHTLTLMSHFSNNSGVGADLTSCNFPSSILPVSWENFSVTLENNESVSVSWEVSQQINNKGYYVERSNDGATWSELGFEPNNETTATSVTYNFSDNNPYKGKNYYRIRQVDLDGNENYSEIRIVNMMMTASAVSVWPNPAKNVISLQNNDGSYIMARIYNQSGAMVSENKLIPGINTLNISSLSFGAYIVSMKKNNGENNNVKIIKE